MPGTLLGPCCLEPIFISWSKSINFPFFALLSAQIFYFSLSFKALRSPIPFCLNHRMMIKLFFPPALFNASFSRPPLTLSEKPLIPGGGWGGESAGWWDYRVEIHLGLNSSRSSTGWKGQQQTSGDFIQWIVDWKSSFRSLWSRIWKKCVFQKEDSGLVVNDFNKAREGTLGGWP